MRAIKEAAPVEGLSRLVLEHMVDRSSEGMLLADACRAGFPALYANRAYEELTGCAAAELTGSPWPWLQASVQQPELDMLRAAMERREPCEVTVANVCEDGTTWFSQVTIEPLYASGGDLKYILCRQRPAAAPGANATVAVGLLERELGRARQKIASLSRIDPVTGLLRLESFIEVLARELGVARREARPVALLRFEVVELDVYRRTFGAKAADSCLRMIAAQATGTLRRAGDVCARAEGDALIAFVRGQDQEEARAVAARIARNVRGLGLHNPRATSGHYVSVRFAVTGCVPGAGDDAETMLERVRAELDPPGHAQRAAR